MDSNAKIYVAGHTGLLGSAVVRKLRNVGYGRLLLRTHEELDLRRFEPTVGFFEATKPDYVFMCAAKVGGIKANADAPADFLLENLQLQNNVIEASRRARVKKLLFVGSSCAYPKGATCPIAESALLTGPFEPTNEGYALAKVAGSRLCQAYRHQHGCNFITAIPTNLFGINDRYDHDRAHVLPALIAKLHRAKAESLSSITIWGSGVPRREFMLSDDCADALVFLMDDYDGADPVNVGTGEDLSIVELAEAVARVVGVTVTMEFDSSKPDGVMRKVLDVSRLRALGWSSRVKLEDGIRIAYADYTGRVACETEPNDPHV
ncbi:GDP-L-fucose synthase family protein [Planctomycetota bacterium]